MRPSRFNVRTTGPDGNARYANTRSGVVVQVDAEADAFLRGETPAPEHLVDVLRETGLGVHPDADEIADVFADYELARNENTLALTISPTVACNLRCDYCFEVDHPNRRQSDADIDAIIRLVRREIAERSPRTFDVTWFGGEPLLHMAAIERLSKAFIGLASFSGVAYSASIITNGTRLTTDVARRLRACRVASAQITLDGGRSTHDLLRVDGQGRGSFDAVLAGIEAAAGALDVRLRIHADHRTARTIPRLIDELRERRLTDLSIAFVRIEPPGIFEPAGPVAKRFMTAAEFARHEVEWLRAARDAGFSVTQTIDSDHGPTPCMAVNPHHYSIEPGGLVNRCYADVAGREPAGRVDDAGRVEIDDRPWREYLPADLGCAECAYLPLCVGGCPKARIDGALATIDDEQERVAFKEDYVCSARKFNLSELMHGDLLV